MADVKGYAPLAVDPPKYEDAAIQHGAAPATKLPTRPAGSGTLPRGPFPLDIPILQQLKGKRVILASASPRRKYLLATIGLVDLEITPSTKPENLSKTELTPFEYVLATAIQKCQDVYTTTLETQIASIPDPTVVIAADTIIVTTSGRILEKPRSEADHIAMLKMLRDQGMHRCYTAVCVIAPRDDARHPGYNEETTVEETKVFFDQTISDDLILAYVKTREGVDKAGGYGMQGMGALLIEKVEGTPDSVVGLPVKKTLQLIERAVFNQEDDGDGEESDVDEI
ncbi:acetylserotonin methytransferase-like protein-like protein [Coleophoma crateriformis]|uniref:Acetylserotonin methytransferase-like protein-like protein n=1 Tax=Coleophoma crateriformis TaxID=565419 RepID=A0A3D8SN72_9HELO|nr:acetylserotonin methytransferase-like protein-like protein [Coleophoma crateriformis]